FLGDEGGQDGGVAVVVVGEFTSFFDVEWHGFSGFSFVLRLQPRNEVSGPDVNFVFFFGVADEDGEDDS
ncbi:TPA: hypothetical protein DCE37_13070, partial [Candidatus Latescibacteria bacterium]|nr:hypothetical protein [Candidatus Latescibacterota bacterium]